MASFPDFYDPARIGTLFYPDSALIAAQAESAGLPAAGADARRVLLLIVDMQVDFCHPAGSLFVPGAREDIRRLIEFIYCNARKITRIGCSLDSHRPFQIFHPAWWVDAAGRHPQPFTLITTADVEAGRWRPVFDPEWSLQYVQRLQHESKQQLTIWPYHVPIGGIGNALDPELWSAVFWHALARRSPMSWWRKGSLARTEHYSILKPEIEVPGEPESALNQDILRSMEDCDLVVIAGEAASHCVLETLEDLVEVFRGRPEQIGKIRLLIDCTSAVVHPQIDFGALARRRFEELAKLGLQLAASTDPL